MKMGSTKKSYDFRIHTVSGKSELNNFRNKEPFRKCIIQQRYLVSLFAFLTCFLTSVTRLVLSVAIVDMVQHKQENETSYQNGTDISCPLPSSTSKSTARSNFQGEFDWSPEMQGYLIGISFLSLLVTQIPAGRFADSVGSKPLLVYSNVLTSVFTMISPFAARWHLYALMAVQFSRGACQGFILPSVFKAMSNWIPKNERGTLSTLVVSGYATGIAFGGMATGWICDIPGLGWPSTFYIAGGLTMVLSVAIKFLYYEHPMDNPWITDEEIKYITDSLEKNTSEKNPSTPWKKIFTSVPCYAYFYGLFGHYWSIAYYVTVHPTFMGRVLHFSITENGVSSCLPVLMKSVGGFTSSIMCYWLTKKNLIGIPKLRKLTTAFGAFGFALLMAGILAARCNVVINIMCCTISLFTAGIALSGIMISGVDMAPTFAGSIMGVASTIANLAFVLIPIITGWVTAHETLSEWQTIFWINLIVVGTSGLVYILFGSAEVQSWNYPESEHPADGLTEEKQQENEKN